MASIGKNASDTLHELKAFIKDRNEGYLKAAQESENPLFKKFYKELADQQTLFANELADTFKQTGSNSGAASPANESATAGEYFRQWTEAKAKFVSRDEPSIVEYSIDAEEWANKAYTHALDNYAFSDHVRQILEKQREASLTNLTKLTEMKASD